MFNRHLKRITQTPVITVLGLCNLYAFLYSKLMEFYD